MKKFASLFLALALCMGLTVPAFAAEYGSVSFQTGIDGAIVTFDAAVKGEPVKHKVNMADLGAYDMEYIPLVLQPGSKMSLSDDEALVLVEFSQLDANGVMETLNSEYFTSGSINRFFEGNDDKILTIPGWDGNYLVQLGDSATTPAEPEKPAEPTVPNFTDMAAGAYYADAVKWAVDKEITAGTTATTFSPNNTCTTAHILTFLWRANGSPAPTGKNAAVPAGKYYTDAANWALEKGLTEAFNPDAPATRAATVTYLWKLAGKPAADAVAFTDVDTGAEYAQAVAWAVKEGITTGTTTTTFAPNNTCTRGQIVTFLYRDLA